MFSTLLLNVFNSKPPQHRWKPLICSAASPAAAGLAGWTRLMKDLQKSLDGYREPRLLCRKEYRPFLFCRNFFILNVKQQVACQQPDIQSVFSNMFEKKKKKKKTHNPRSNREGVELKTLPHPCTRAPQPCPREQRVSVHQERVSRS